MASPRERASEKAVGVLSLLIVGLGLLDLFANVLPGVPFFLVFVIGFAVVLPIVSLLLGVDDDEDDRLDDRLRGEGDADSEGGPEGATDTSTADAIETLRDRYARGELTDDQFERKLDRLLATDTPENAADWRRGERERDREREFER